MLKWKRFDYGDWATYAGASPFLNGSDPWIAPLLIDGNDCHAINGPSEDGEVLLEIHCWDGELTDHIWKAEGPDAMNAVLALEPEMTLDQLLKLRFERVN